MAFFLFLFFLIIIKCSEKKDLLNDNKRNLEEESNEYNNIKIYVNYGCLLQSISKIKLELLFRL